MEPGASDLPVLRHLASGSSPNGMDKLPVPIATGHFAAAPTLSADGAQITVGRDFNSNNNTYQLIFVISPRGPAGSAELDPAELNNLVDSISANEAAIVSQLTERQESTRGGVPQDLSELLSRAGSSGMEAPASLSSFGRPTSSLGGIIPRYATYGVSWYLLEKPTSTQSWKLPGGLISKFSPVARKVTAISKHIQRIEELYRTDIFIRQRTEDGDYLYKRGYLDAQNQEYLIELWNIFLRLRRQFHGLGDWKNDEDHLKVLEGSLKHIYQRAQFASTRLKQTFKTPPSSSEGASSVRQATPGPSSISIPSNHEESQTVSSPDPNASVESFSTFLANYMDDPGRPASQAAGSINEVPPAIFYRDTSGSFHSLRNPSLTSIIPADDASLLHPGEDNPIMFTPAKDEPPTRSPKA